MAVFFLRGCFIKAETGFLCGYLIEVQDLAEKPILSHAMNSETGFLCGFLIEVQDVAEKPLFSHLPIQFGFSPTGEML